MSLIKKFLLWCSKRKINQLKDGNLFLIYRHSYSQTTQFWGIFKNYMPTSGGMNYITYYDLEKNETAFLPIERTVNTIYLINRKNDVCKDWFNKHSIEDYLTHQLDHVRKWAKEELAS